MGTPRDEFPNRFALEAVGVPSISLNTDHLRPAIGFITRLCVKLTSYQKTIFANFGENQ